MKTKTTKKEKFTFAVDNNWKPTKVFGNDEFLEQLADAVKKLTQGQSIPLSCDVLNKRYGWKKGDSMLNAIRHYFQKRLSDSFMAKISLHAVKNEKGIVDSIRIRHK